VPHNLSYDRSELWKHNYALGSRDQSEVSAGTRVNPFTILFHTVFCVNRLLLEFIELGLRASYKLYLPFQCPPFSFIA